MSPIPIVASTTVASVTHPLAGPRRDLRSAWAPSMRSSLVPAGRAAGLPGGPPEKGRAVLLAAPRHPPAHGDAAHQAAEAEHADAGRGQRTADGVRGGAVTGDRNGA